MDASAKATEIQKNFSPRILIINGNPYVRPPQALLESIFRQAGKDKGPISVRGKLNEAPFQQSVVRYQGDWKLYINGIMAKKAGLDYTGSITAIVGREVKVEVEFDPHPPTYPMIEPFQKALNKHPRAKSAYEQLTPGRKKEILRYFSFMKSKEALQRNIEKALQVLSGKEARFMARTWKNGK